MRRHTTITSKYKDAHDNRAHHAFSHEPPIRPPVYDLVPSNLPPIYGPIQLYDIVAPSFISAGGSDYSLSMMANYVMRDESTSMGVDDIVYATMSVIWLEMNYNLLTPRMTAKADRLARDVGVKWREIFTCFVMLNYEPYVYRYVHSTMVTEFPITAIDKKMTYHELEEILSTFNEHFGSKHKIIIERAENQSRTRVVGVEFNGRVEHTPSTRHTAREGRHAYMGRIMSSLRKELKWDINGEYPTNPRGKHINHVISQYLMYSTRLIGFDNVRRYCGGHLQDFIRCY